MPSSLPPLVRRVQSRLPMVWHISGLEVWEMDIAGGAVCCDAQTRLIMGLNRSQKPNPLSLWRRAHPSDRRRVREALIDAVQGDGDALLRQVARRLQAQVRGEDTVACLGCDAFVVLLSQLVADPERAGHEARLVAKKPRDSISWPFYIAGREHQITPSIGIALFPGHGDCAEEILRFADHAMYRAKAAGRNVIRFFMPGMQHAADRRLQLENDLRHAIERDELRLCLQPRVDRRGRVLGIELCRRGGVRPGETR